MDHIPALICLWSNLPRPLHWPPVFEERLESTHFTKFVTATCSTITIETGPATAAGARHNKQQQWRQTSQALFRSQILAISCYFYIHIHVAMSIYHIHICTNVVSGSYAACISSPEKDNGKQLKKSFPCLLSSWSTRRVATYHTCIVCFCLRHLLLELLVLLPGELLRPQRPPRPPRTFWTPSTSLELLFEKIVRFQLCLKDRKTMWTWTITMRQTSKGMYFLVLISWSKRSIHSCKVLKAFWF